MPKRDKHNYFLNRELSWIGFNRRVLEQALDRSLPPLERMKFMAITSSNLDEFFMVRVGGLQLRREAGKEDPDPAGYTTTEQLDLIREAVLGLCETQYACLLDELEPTLAREGIERLPMKALDARQVEHADRFFEQEVYPVVTPLAVDGEHPFPLVSGLGLNLLIRLAPAKGGRTRFAVVTLPRILPRYITLPSEKGLRYILIEDLIAARLDRLFPGQAVVESAAFRIARNADMGVREDLAADLLVGMRDVLSRRKRGDCVRIEVDAAASSEALDFLKASLDADDDILYPVRGPLDLTYGFALAGAAGFGHLKIADWPPQPSPAIDPDAPLFDQIARGDILLFHPYESFEPVVRFVEEAADDPNVLAIKQILYRTSANSPIVAALQRAADRGKHVSVLVELKARFDEERNIEWAQMLERAGAQVVYGVMGLKVHAKICLVVRREAGGVKRYVHLATGNYNEKTAKLYSDVSLFTCAEAFGADASSFFNTITGYSEPVPFQRLRAAPTGLLDRLLELIENETERRKQGQEGHIMAKANALVHPKVIDALFKASQAGVRIDLNIRGICCLRPSLTRGGGNIRVVSIVDRFLEHSRIFYFRNGGDPLVYIASADWMPRNLDRRVELMTPIENPALRRHLIDILHTYFEDNVQAWQLQREGDYRRLTPGKGGKAVRSQEVFYREAQEAASAAQRARRRTIQPILAGRPKGKKA